MAGGVSDKPRGKRMQSERLVKTENEYQKNQR